MLVVVTVTDSIADATANLLAPIVIAAAAGTAVQLVLPDADLPLRAPLLTRQASVGVGHCVPPDVLAGECLC